jgi:hypothetical protein
VSSLGTTAAFKRETVVNAGRRPSKAVTVQVHVDGLRPEDVHRLRRRDVNGLRPRYVDALRARP